MNLWQLSLKWVTKASPPRDILLTVAGALVGWGISHYYYVQALDDMKADAEERRRVEELVFRGIESIGTIKYHRDSSGKVEGVVIEISGEAKAESSGSASLTVHHQRE